MRRGMGADIVKLLASDLDFTNTSRKGFWGSPAAESINNVRRIAIVDKGSMTEFNIDSTAQPPSYTYLGRPVDGGDFISFYIKCINLVASATSPGVRGASPKSGLFPI